jgi:hypothetical protein
MIRLRLSARCSGTKSLIASARRDEVGVIYPNLPWLTRLNSHPINADRYLIDWRGLLGPFKNGIGGCALLPQLDRVSPRSIPWTAPSSAEPGAGTALRRSSTLPAALKVEIRFCAPLDLLAVYKQGMYDA